MEQYTEAAPQDQVKKSFEPAQLFESRITRERSYAIGKSKRKNCPRESLADWKEFAGRRDTIELVEEAEKGRVAELLPLRHGRMVASPFTFYRGSAINMAADLASTSSS